ncbi:hypothetical protein [Clostridium sp.]|uniref:hypothetical protein n=1 Tax=Clostridium sp. TaxID=1506 RepID=UPI003994FAFB
MLNDLNILLDLGFSEIRDNENIVGYKIYFEDLNNFIIVDMNGMLYFGVEYKFMEELGNLSDIAVRNMQEVIPSLRYHLFKKINSKKNFGFADKCKGIFFRDVNA